MTVDLRKTIDVEVHASDTMKLYNDVIELVHAAKYLDAYNKCKEYFDFSEREEDTE